MEIDYKIGLNIDSEQLDILFEKVGWRKRGNIKWKEVLAKSYLGVSAWDNDKLVGFGRITEDGVMCMFYDIGILPDYQGKGIGSAIMKILIDKVKDKEYASIGLFAWEENPINFPFYEKFGFEKVKSGMELVKFMKRE